MEERYINRSTQVGSLAERMIWKQAVRDVNRAVGAGELQTESVSTIALRIMRSREKGTEPETPAALMGQVGMRVVDREYVWYGGMDPLDERLGAASEKLAKGYAVVCLDAVAPKYVPSPQYVQPVFERSKQLWRMYYGEQEMPEPLRPLMDRVDRADRVVRGRMRESDRRESRLRTGKAYGDMPKQVYPDPPAESSRPRGGRRRR